MKLLLLLLTLTACQPVDFDNYNILEQMGLYNETI